MKIGNVRIGFATNSSSSHSIILVKDSSKVVEYDYALDDDYYGWEDFVLKSATNKLEYLAAQMYSSYKRILGEKIAGLVIKDFFGDRIERLREGVDHQSCFSIPIGREHKDIPEDFINEMVKFFSNENVVVCGGNDNSENTSLDKINVEYKEISLPDLWSKIIWVKKQNDGWWTLFSPETGMKTSINFNTDSSPFTKGRTPDLIDIKITDYCEANCTYCYQDSSVKGKHASYTTISSYIRTFKKMDVFEIAIGGGEPTKHPLFAQILREARESGIIPSFSTKSFDWMTDLEILRAVDKYAGKIGFSCSTQDEVRALIYHINKSKLPREKFVVHYVLGSSPIDELSRMLDTISNAKHLDVLLLGYKETGRGSKFTPYDNSQWGELLKNNSYGIRVGVDTCVAAQYEDTIKGLNVSTVLYYKDEGKFSMYIDAVENKVARSSFEKRPEDYIRLQENLVESSFSSGYLLNELEGIFNGL